MTEYERDTVIDAWAALSTALAQQAKSDDKIIMDHVRDACATLNVLRKTPVAPSIQELARGLARIEVNPDAPGWQCETVDIDEGWIIEYADTPENAFRGWLEAVLIRRSELEEKAVDRG